MLSNTYIKSVVHAALAEDLGVERFTQHALQNDITCATVIPDEAILSLTINTRQACTLSGLSFAEAALHACDPNINFMPKVKDGDSLVPGTNIATISGNARAILTAERTALNFMQHLSGIATLTQQYVDAISHTNATLLDTRKTTPGLRLAEKYAVTCGGGKNHRLGLYDAIMIKDNHASLASKNFDEMVALAVASGHPAIIECDTSDQVETAFKEGAKHLLLDNMTLENLKVAVHLNKDYGAKLEASGGVDLTTIAAIAETGVHYISTSKITQAAMPIDIGLDECQIDYSLSF